MRKLVRWVALAAAGLLVLIIVVGAALYFMGGARLGRTYDPQVARIPIPTDSASVARGGHLVEAVTLCHGCHGEDLAGGVLVDEPGIARIYASNLTSGRGGVGGVYTDVDWVRAIRHGVNPEGRGLMIMHSDAYQKLGMADLAAIVAYVKSVPPVDREHPPTRGAALGKVFIALGLFDTESMPLIPAEVIDHTAPLPQVPSPSVTADYGRYLVSVSLCAMCHGPTMTGGPPIEEGAPAAPSVATYGETDGWSEEQFLGTIRTGVTPDGRALDPEHMPWTVYARMTDDELRAIRMYLAAVAGASGS